MALNNIYLNFTKGDMFMNEQQKAIRDARTLGIPKMLLLGLQHMFAMFGATILVPILVNSYFNGEGLSIQVSLFFAGIGTLFFHVCTVGNPDLWCKGMCKSAG